MAPNNLIIIRKIICLALALGLVTGGGLKLYASSSTQQQLNEAQQEANRVQSEINNNKQELERLEGEANTISGQLQTYNDQLLQAVNELNQTENDISAKELEIEIKQEELEKAKQVEEKQHDDLMEHIQYMYESGLTESYLNMISEATSFSDFLNITEYVEQISAYDMKRLEEFCAIREFVEAEEAELQLQYEELQLLKSSQEENRNKVNALVNQTKSSLDNKNSEIDQKENEVTAQEEELATIKDNIAELQQKLAEELRLSQAAANAEWRDISEVSFSEEDVTMLANLIYCEARGESYDGQLAVASVVINRVLSSQYPGTVAGVIYQSGQFAPVTSTKNSFVDALANDKAANSAGCYQAAREAISGITNVSNCVYFQTIAYLEQVERLDVVRYVIGNHGFY